MNKWLALVVKYAPAVISAIFLKKAENSEKSDGPVR